MPHRTDPTRDAVAGFMRAHPVTLSHNATFAEAVDALDIYQVGCLPVVDDCGAFLGLLPATAVLTALATQPLGSVAEDRVWPAVVRDAPTLAPADSMAQAPALLANDAIGVLPVIEDGQVIGTIGHAEACRYLCAVSRWRRAEHGNSET